MAFQFQLEAVLRLHRGRERQDRLKLEAIASELDQARRQLEFVVEMHLESRRRFRDELREQKYGSELELEEARSTNVEAARRALQLRVSELDEQRLKQLAVFIESRRRREVLETLREGQFEVYRRTRSRREQQEIDDLFLMRHGFLRDE